MWPKRPDLFDPVLRSLLNKFPICELRILPVILSQCSSHRDSGFAGSHAVKIMAKSDRKADGE